MKLELNVEDGEVKFNIFHLLQELSDEKKKILLEDGGWLSFISDEMAKEIVSGFSRENYNSLYGKLREIILTSESMNKIVREWAIAQLEEKERAQKSESYWRNQYFILYHFCNDYNETMWKEMPKLSSREYGGGPRISKEMIESIVSQIQCEIDKFPHLVDKLEE